MLCARVFVSRSHRANSRTIVARVRARACLLRVVAFALLLCARGLSQENVLVLVADDVGVDRVACYAEHPDPGHTPNIDALAARGVLFRNAWASPLCSPTRAGLLTGRCAFRTGVGDVVDYTGGKGLQLAEWTLPELLDAGTAGAWDHAAIGKWHLGTSVAGPMHPLLSGFRRYRGALGNLGSDAAPGNYFSYLKAVDGRFVPSRVYATTDTVDDALDAVAEMSEPWLLYVCFNAAHKPYHAPPDALQSYDLSGSAGPTPALYMQAMTEAMDTEIGRLLRSLPPPVLRRTDVIFLGDNGTDGDATTPPFKPLHAKGTVYEGGVNVPLIVAGPRVARPGSECAALVQATDLFATVADVAGIVPAAVLPPDTTLDSVSLLPYLADPSLASLRRHVFTETFAPNGKGPYSHVERALRDARWKLVRKVTVLQGPGGPIESTTDELYDLPADPFEQHDLLDSAPVPADAAAAYTELKAALEALLASGP